LKFWGDVLGIFSSTLKLDFLALFGFCCSKTQQGTNNQDLLTVDTLRVTLHGLGGNDMLIGDTTDNILIERLNQSVKQRTKVAKIFVNEDSCLKFWGDVLGIISSTLKLDFLALFGFCCLALH
jgi:membrane protein YqaA with SNARE-associated domain